MYTTNFPISNTPRILLADDQQDVLEALRLLLKSEGFVIEAVNSPAAVIKALSDSDEREFDLMLIDLNYTRDTTSGQEGLELIEQVRHLDDTLPVVVMTAWGSIELAVETMREGGGDFIQKPWDNDRLLSVLHTQLERGRKLRQEKQGTLARQKTQQREFEEARLIQESLLPTTLPEVRGIDLAVSWQPMREVGGDYFDVIKIKEDLDDGKIAICIADVEGKGLPAAMLMSNLQASVRSLARQSLKPGEMCEQVNRAMLQNSAGHKLITMFYALVDVAQAKLSYANAGHHAPLLVGDNGRHLQLSVGGPPLHLFAETSYGTGDVDLQSGDRILMFTDGVLECCDPAGEEFGEERLQQVMRDHRSSEAEALLQSVKTAITNFSGGDFQDDVTMIAVHYL